MAHQRASAPPPLSVPPLPADGSMTAAQFCAAARLLERWWAVRAPPGAPGWYWTEVACPLGGPSTGFLCMQHAAPALLDDDDDGSGCGNANSAATASAAPAPPPPLLFFEYHVAHHVSYQVPVLCFRVERLIAAAGDAAGNASADDDDASVFRAAGSSGGAAAALDVDALRALLPAMWRYKGGEGSGGGGSGSVPDWAFVARQAHPCLPGGPPWHMLHPCQTAQLLRLMLGGGGGGGGGGALDGDGGDGGGGGALDGDGGDGGGGGALDGELGGGGGGDAALLRYMTAWLSVVGPVVGVPSLLHMRACGGACDTHD